MHYRHKLSQVLSDFIECPVGIAGRAPLFILQFVLECPDRLQRAGVNRKLVHPLHYIFEVVVVLLVGIRIELLCRRRYLVFHQAQLCESILAKLVRHSDVSFEHFIVEPSGLSVFHILLDLLFGHFFSRLSSLQR